MNTVPSPCIRNCCLDKQDICLGCFRSLEEIKNWAASSDSEKNRVLQQASKRRQLARKNPPRNG